jgi:opacity protein-like surface antigen
MEVEGNFYAFAESIMPGRASIVVSLFLLGATIGSVIPAPATAQGRPGIRPAKQSQVILGAAGVLEVPRGQFDAYVGNGYGLSGSLLLSPRSTQAVQLRVDLGFVQYGSETKHACFGGDIGCLISVDVNTTNDILVGGIGPQFMVPTGWVRPYVTGTVGFAYFFTKSSVEGSNDSEPFASTKHFDDFVFAWTGGGGVLIPVRQAPSLIAIDLGVRYHGNGKVSYLREGGITTRPDGSLVINPIRSDANFLSFQLGVAFGL